MLTAQQIQQSRQQLGNTSSTPQTTGKQTTNWSDPNAFAQAPTATPNETLSESARLSCHIHCAK